MVGIVGIFLDLLSMFVELVTSKPSYQTSFPPCAKEANTADRICSGLQSFTTSGGSTTLFHASRFLVEELLLLVVELERVESGVLVPLSILRQPARFKRREKKP